jgi:hypothetical protein
MPTPDGLSRHDKAGERILLACAQAYQQRINATVKLYKNNTDYHGSSYGTHESYLLRRDIPFETLASTMTPFLTTRLIYAGRGQGRRREQSEPARAVPD